jgi:hypothetical protein
MRLSTKKILNDSLYSDGVSYTDKVNVIHSQKRSFKGGKIASIQAKVENQVNWIDTKAERKKEREAKRRKNRKCYTL